MDYHSSLPKSQSTYINDRVAHIYYSHGLFCSSHPYAVILATLAILAVCCYPLLHLPLLGSSSQHFSTPAQGFIPPEIKNDQPENYQFNGPRWFQGPPVGYVQQVVVKSAVSPWQHDLILTDAFRAPLAEAFRIREIINNHQVFFKMDNITTLSDVCLQVSEPIDNVAAASLPHFGCLLLSPVNIWRQDANRFHLDSDIMKTIFRQRDSTSDSYNLREILFGVPWKETGIKKLYVRSRPRILTYAITVIFKTFNADFIHSLYNQLRLKYPSSPYPENITYSPDDSNISHIHFQELHTLAEFVPLGVAYVILFLYIYFSVRKIELVKSKWALAVSAVMTVVMSLLMSVGLCLWFGLNPTLNGSEILPYLVVVIGLENMLVLTKSVVSTPVHLDVKLRIAQGLSKEGWSITKNLLTELVLLTVAFLTFVPAIQEFCLFAVVGLLTDFFLQLVFFATFLSIDIRRMEISDIHKGINQQTINIGNTKHQNMLTSKDQGICRNMMNSSVTTQTRLVPPKTRHKGSFATSQYSARIIAPPATPMLVKLPKRMKFIYFWARTRIVQRGLMICLVVWIVLLVYKSGIVERLTENTTTLAPTIAEQVVRPILQTFTRDSNLSKDANQDSTESKQWKTTEHIITEFSPGNVGLRLKHRNIDMWQTMSAQHWTTLFGYYNISLSGRYISILPPVHLSIAIDPSVALELRNPGDIETSKRSHWKFLGPGEQKDRDDDMLASDLPYHPSSPAEVALAIALAIPSLLFLIYLMVVLYRCMCSRHYAEWRSSWRNSNISNGESIRGSSSEMSASDAYLVMETLPVKLHGHTQELENIVTEDNVIVSSCLAGDICVWDAVSGDCLTIIRRSRISQNRAPLHGCVRGSGSFSSDSTYSSSPPSDVADCFNYHSSSAPASFSAKNTTKNHSNNVFMKQFSFDEKFSYGPEYAVPGKIYDFSKFITSEDNFVEDESYLKTHHDTYCSKDCCKESHEYQLQKENRRDYSNNMNCVYYSPLPHQPIWCMDYCGNCIAIGCKDGRMELWNAFSGNLEYVYEESKSGITAVCLSYDRLVAARLNGVLEFFLIEVQGVDSNYSQMQSNDVNSASCENGKVLEDAVQCIWFQSVKAHTLAVSALEVESGLVVSGGYDRLVKVFRCDSAMCIYTLHGHTAPISALNIDQLATLSASSGCQDGMICLWDLMTGTCMYSLNAHQGAVMTLQSTNMYIVSQGTDNRICIWEKCQGHLLHSIHQDYGLCSNLILLTSSIMVTTKEDNLVLWDVNHGEALRMIMVGSGDHSAHIRILKLAGQSVICDYGSQMFIINFPAVSDKTD